MKDRSPPDLATPLNSQGGYGNAMGPFSLKQSLRRKVRSRKDLSQPKRTEDDPILNHGEDDSITRYYGDFSIESKRHVRDLLKKHPEFGDDGVIRKNRIRNNTTEVLTNDPIRIVTNGGYIVYKHPEEPKEHETNEPQLSRSKNLFK